MKMFIFLTLVIFSVGISEPIFACQFDTDCSVGSKCLKQSGKLKGMCVAGMNPGNNNDRNPYRNPLDISQKRGNTCSFDTDCGVGNMCAKGNGQIKGTCMKR
jgi:hypothetical protein